MKGVALEIFFLSSIVRLALIDSNSADVAAGEISGRVRLLGDSPPARILPLDAPCAREYKELPRTRFLLTGAHDGLADVVVYISAGLQSSKWTPAQERLELKETRCLIEPYVSAVQTHQHVAIRNEDDMLHNILADGRRNVPSNHASFPKTLPMDLAFATPEFFIPLKCDVHPWEIAYVSVIEHPFFAVTDKDGGFRIAGVPSGSYTLTARHRLAGTSSAEIQVRAGEPSTVEFTLEVPKYRPTPNGTPTAKPVKDPE
jgi:hypothetical protein